MKFLLVSTLWGLAWCGLCRLDLIHTEIQPLSVKVEKYGLKLSEAVS